MNTSSIWSCRSTSSRIKPGRRIWWAICSCRPNILKNKNRWRRWARIWPSRKTWPWVRMRGSSSFWMKSTRKLSRSISRIVSKRWADKVDFQRDLTIWGTSRTKNNSVWAWSRRWIGSCRVWICWLLWRRLRSEVARGLINRFWVWCSRTSWIR